MTKNNKISNEIRFKIIQNYNNNKTQKQLAEIFCIPKSTIYSIIKAYLKDGRTEKKQKGGSNNKKINDEICQFIRQEMDKKCDSTLKSISIKVFEKFNIQLSVTTIANALKNMHCSFKRIKVVAEEAYLKKTCLSKKNLLKNFKIY